MANTATLVSATPSELIYRLLSDGSGAASPTIANATLLTDMVNGPLQDAWNQEYANQAAMRSALLGGLRSGQGFAGGCIARIQNAVAVVMTDAERNQVTCDVDVDATTATKAEINIGMSQSTAGQVAYLHLVHWDSKVG